GRARAALLRRGARAACARGPPCAAAGARDGRDLPNAARRDRGRRLPRAQAAHRPHPGSQTLDRVAHLGHGVTRVAVVGAGWAGLAAAVTLAERGVPVTVFEASRSVGGRARRGSIAGVGLDTCQHVLIGAYRRSLRLMRLVGADPERLLLRVPLELRFADGFHLRAPRLLYPFNLGAALLGAKGLSLAESASAARFMASLRLRGFKVEPDRSVSAFLDEHR